MCELEATAGHASPPAAQHFSDHASSTLFDAIVHDKQCGEGAPALVKHMCGLKATAGHASSPATPQSYHDHASPVHIDAIVSDKQC
eukprot:3601850-Karenia_brevis.AAC.1